VHFEHYLCAINIKCTIKVLILQIEKIFDST
jgi:hypothetical protein